MKEAEKKTQYYKKQIEAMKRQLEASLGVDK